MARELDRVLETCRAAGWDTQVEYTSPPKGEPGGKHRVIRCRELAGGRLLLTAAREVPGN
ncbi:MAG: hypothetical protein MJA84_13585 [Firmicutes bacterium]|nr:hypothetical protein [Bacillota bacterium]